MRIGKQAIPHNPVMPLRRVLEFRSDLIREEDRELRSAVTLEEIADAIGDLLYVVYGTAVACGLDAQGIFNEVHRSNMTKFADGLRLSPHGKILKGPSFSPPDLQKFCK